MSRKATPFDDTLQEIAQSILGHPEAPRTVVILVVPKGGGMRLSVAYDEEPDDGDSLVRGLLHLAAASIAVVPEGKLPRLTRKPL